MRALIATGAALALVLAAAPSAHAPYPQPAGPPAGAALERARAQLATARTHAGFAAEAGTLPGIRQHTGHAVNCLVGAGDRRFDRRWGHVCEGQGNGALADLRAGGASAQVMKMAEDATRVGVDTLGQDTLAAAQAGAKKLAGMLDDVLKALR